MKATMVLHVKMAWWWKPVYWAVLRLAALRAVSVDKAWRLIHGASRKALIVRTERQ